MNLLLFCVFHQLLQGRQSIDQPCLIFGGDLDLICVDVHQIAFSLKIQFWVYGIDQLGLVFIIASFCFRQKITSGWKGKA